MRKTISLAVVAALLFVVSFASFVQPGTAQAAQTLGNIFGCETTDLLEAKSTAGTPACVSYPVHAGDRALLVERAGGATDTVDIVMMSGNATDSDNDFFMGVALWFDGFTDSGNHEFLAAYDDANGQVWNITQLGASGNWQLNDANGSQITSIANPASRHTWHYLEVVWQDSASGTITIHLDGSQIFNAGSQDLTDGGGISVDSAYYRFSGAASDTDADLVVDDFYSYSGGTGTGGFHGNAEVFRFQSRDSDAVPDRACSGLSAQGLAAGVWSDLGETPQSTDTTEPAISANGGGAVDTNDTASGLSWQPGPNGHGEIDGDSNIKGAKWVHVLKRGNGSGTTHYACYGDTSGTLPATQTVTLDVTYGYFYSISEATTAVPSSSEYFSLGMAKDGGGRNILAEEMWAFLLHVPTASDPSPSLELGNIFGCETNDTGEVHSSVSASCDGAARSGDWSLSVFSGQSASVVGSTGETTTHWDAGFVVGAAIWHQDLSPSAEFTFFAARDNADATLWELRMETDGQLKVTDANGVVIGSCQNLAVLSSATWQFYEVWWEHGIGDDINVYIDGSSVCSATGQDLTASDPFGKADGNYYFAGGGNNEVRADDLYSYSGASGVGNFLGDAEVYRYQANTNSATPDSGSDLDAGVWQDLGETPLSADATEPSYTGVKSGEMYTDDTQSGNNYRPGPNGDSNIDNDASIRAAKYLWYLRRGSGGSNSHQIRYGNNVDTITSTTVTVSSGYSYHSIVTTDGNIVPTSSQYFALGFGRTSGGDLFGQEMWAFILHVPTAESTRRIFTIS